MAKCNMQKDRKKIPDGKRYGQEAVMIRKVCAALTQVLLAAGVRCCCCDIAIAPQDEPHRSTELAPAIHRYQCRTGSVAAKKVSEAMRGGDISNVAQREITCRRNGKKKEVRCK